MDNCDKFKALKISDRLAKVKELKLCVNCFESGHYVRNCTKPLCQMCNQRHHSLLHFKSRSANLTQEQVARPTTEPIVTNIVASGTHKVLPTASVLIKDQKGRDVTVRVILDNCSTDNIVTKACVKKLGLETQPFFSPVTGIGCSQTPSSELAKYSFQSKTSSFASFVTATVVEKITTSLPSVTVDQGIQRWVRKQGLPITDSDFAQTKQIDMLLGVEIFFEILENQIIAIPRSKLKFIATKLGWIVAGSWGQQAQNPVVCHISTRMERFWETEELPIERQATEEHRLIENHFLETHTRLANGRFVVRLPFRENRNKLSNCRVIALRKFQNLERRGISSEYSNFMKEYLALGHMRRADLTATDASYFIPHFSVVSSNKFRVVFHASTKGEGGLSLNDVMMTGPTLQADLFSILLRFRNFRYAFSTDIVKMYRQIAINPVDYDFQRIFWREGQSQEKSEYHLTTVTYGTSPASFLATRCLFQLTHEHAAIYPLACKAINEQSYVDDILSGAVTLQEAMETKNQLIALLRHGCFELSKWRSNDTRLVNSNDSADSTQLNVTPIGESKMSSAPTLGLNWNATSDNFSFSKLKMDVPRMEKVTKRVILSQTAKLYDPLGLISPIILRGKLIFQKLWLTSCAWDDVVPKEDALAFRKFRRDLENIEQVKIPRYVLSHDACRRELHVFGDASEKAYAAVAYLRIVRDNDVDCSLLCSKTLSSRLLWLG